MTDSEQLLQIRGLLENVVSDLDGLKTDVNGLKTDVNGLKTDVEALKVEMVRTNDRVETYQKSSQQVVNLAFGLIVAATAAIVVPAVLAR